MNILFSVAAASLAFASPALADGRPSAGPTPTPGATSAIVQPSGNGQSSATGQSTVAARPTRYCVMTEPATGTRIWQRICQTRDDWLKQGFDPLATRK